VSDYLQRILEPPEASFFLFGPRGAGKTTWLKQRFHDALRIDLLDEGLYQSLLADVERFATELRSLPPSSWVIVDEIQRLPRLLNEVHRFLEDRGLRFALCGSSARKLKTGGTNLLAGRAIRCALHPLVPEEMGNRFSLDEALRWGTLPVVWSAPDKRGSLEAYVYMYLKEEIQAESLVRSLPGFARFLPVAAVMHGQVTNVSGLARDAQVARTTAAGYLDILEDTLVAFRLPGYEARLRVRERRHPKLYWADPGLPRAIKKQFGEPGPEELGPLFEGWVASLLRAYRDYRRLFDDWFYWSSPGGRRVEVDFLLRRGEDFAAIEVKAGKLLHENDFRGLRALASLPGLVRRLAVYRGQRAGITRDGIEILPVADFLRDVEQGSLFAPRPR